jgi:hypothetical protein
MMSKMVTTSFSENLRRAEKLGLVRGPKQAAKAAAKPTPATGAQKAEQLGRQAAACFDQAVKIAGAAPGSAPSKQAGKIVNRMIAGVVTRRMKG